MLIKTLQPLTISFSKQITQLLNTNLNYIHTFVILTWNCVYRYLRYFTIIFYSWQVISASANNVLIQLTPNYSIIFSSKYLKLIEYQKFSF